MVFTLYRGHEHPFIHALDTAESWALCIDLPATGADDASAALDWGLAVTADGHFLVAANATLGLAAEIPLGDLAVRRSVTFAPTALTAITLAKFGHEASGPVDRRVVISPVGSTLFAAGPGGIVRLDTADLAVTGRFLEGTSVDALALTPDGGTVFALAHAGGRIVRVDATTGKVTGTVPGDGYDRLVAVVPG
jgi:DNA-binding beta-propeller fold protein YncE